MRSSSALKKWSKEFAWVFLLLAVCVFIFPADVQALYIDPGTGSIVLQVLLGAVVGGVVALKLYWARVRAWFVRLFSRSSREDEPGK